MDAVLSDQWLSGLPSIPIYDAASVALVRQEVRARAARLALSDVVCGSLVNIASELGHNQLAHARAGQIAIRELERDGTLGLEIIAADRGLGILDPDRALASLPRPDEDLVDRPKSLGIGLGAVRELSDELDFDVRVGEGSCVWARKFARPVVRRREVGIYGRPYPGEDVSGDQAVFVRDEDNLLVAVVDGLGHGPLARVAADAAVSMVAARAHASFDVLFDDCQRALRSTRGAVMSGARLTERSAALDVASIGNVSLHVTGLGQTRRAGGSAGVLGSAGTQRKLTRVQWTLSQHEVVLLFSDGLTSRFDLAPEGALLHEHPIIIAHQLVQRFGRGNDDALVLVAR